MTHGIHRDQERDASNLPVISARAGNRVTMVGILDIGYATCTGHDLHQCVAHHVMFCLSV
jgi:hypothetical protein